MDAEWRTLGRSPESEIALRRLAEAEPEVGALGVADLDGLVQALRRPEDLAQRDQASQLVRAMLRSAHVHPLLPRCILQALIPGLISVAQRLSWGPGGEWDDGGAFFADLVATTWEVIVEWSGQDRGYAVLDLLSAVRCRLRRQTERHRATREVSTSQFENELNAPVDHSGGITDLDLLARAIDEKARQGLDAADAAVLYGHCVLGLSISELARMTGRSRRHLDGRRLRAVQELCA
jgi:hypothetical protein